MSRVPRWAEWMAEKPGTKNWPAYHRFYWRRIAPWEMRFAVAFAVVLVITAVVLLIALLRSGDLTRHIANPS